MGNATHLSGGGVEVKGTVKNKPVTGESYLEMTGYAGKLT
jgi:hypothetical protein